MECPTCRHPQAVCPTQLSSCPRRASHIHTAILSTAVFLCLPAARAFPCPSERHQPLGKAPAGGSQRRKSLADRRQQGKGLAACNCWTLSLQSQPCLTTVKGFGSSTLPELFPVASPLLEPFTEVCGSSLPFSMSGVVPVLYVLLSRHSIRVEI